ncbi:MULTISPECIES: hypothetical protein [unclassified Pseudoalteromonas]|uniref:hypothetical protein n=1 Tax=unclassified Pseudoalteromonas TaxID=194690 RepID=UPI0025B36344|nr:MULTISPECIES: hypothetical protein [unclassified Pseudoalteromonas]MDN3377300.1 hypothetical protein [Pseudoalteromonas sp. APC 3893]MDN3385532.1 hypothetical protein [Pseudoalteromonas sp. APC 4017]
MKTLNFLISGLTLIVLLPLNTFSAEVDFSSNPFLEENKHVQGPQVFSFSKQPERVPDIFNGSSYVELAKQTQVNGFALVEPNQVIDLTTWIEGFTQYTETFSKKLKPLILAEQSDYDQSHLVNNFAADTDNLESVIGKEFTVKSKNLGGNFIAGKGWDHLTYIVTHPDYEIVVIEVQAFDESSEAVMDADAINYQVKGSPAILYVLQDKTGNASTQLSWLTPQASYNIQLEKNVNTVALQSKFNTLVETITPDD